MISVIILTFNSLKFIKPCLDSILSQDSGKTELIIVDNGSKDGTGVLVRKNYPKIKLIENKDNLGAARARNQGIEMVNGEWLLTLDCDIVLEQGFLRNFNNALTCLASDVGSVQPKILQSDRKNVYSTGIFISRLRRFYDIGKGARDAGQFEKTKYLFGACSAAAFYKKEMLEDIKEGTGYFDERFFFLFEDADLSWRANRKGWRTLFYPQAVCYHTGDSSATPRKVRQALSFRNRYLMINKNESFSGKIKIYLLSFPYELLRLIYLAVSNKYLWKKSPIN